MRTLGLVVQGGGKRTGLDIDQDDRALHAAGGPVRPAVMCDCGAPSGAEHRLECPAWVGPEARAQAAHRRAMEAAL